MKGLEDIVLFKYLRGECSQEELTQVNVWLGMSKDNEALLFDLQAAYDSPIKSKYADEAFLNREHRKLMEKIRLYEKDRSAAVKTSARRRMIVMVTTAAAILVLLVTFGLNLSQKNTAQKEKWLTVAASDQVREVVLPDGTTVWLNEHSSISYPDGFPNDGRQVSLEGEAYFDVVKNPANPFIVKSSSIQVKVLGTTFNMRSFREESSAEASLISGEIEIKGLDGEGQIILTPGQKAEVDLTSKRMTVKAANTRLDAVWRDNLIPFEESSLLEIGRALERFYGVRMVFDRDVDINTRYSGSIPKKDNIEEVLQLLTNSVPMTFELKADTVYISSARD